jgi:PPOX class probable F420-dependent enzyme
MGHKMSPDEIRAFIGEGTRTGHLATVRADGRPHVATIWVVLDGEEIVFTTWHESVKGRNLARTAFAALSVDDPNPPYSFIALEGPVTIVDDPAESARWAEILGARYMGAARADEFGRRNGVPGELVCRLRPSHMTGQFALTD